jgi:hypothetical protein
MKYSVTYIEEFFMKRSIAFAGAVVVVCVLIGIGVAAYAQPPDIRPPEVFGNLPRPILPEINLPEINANMANMSVYERYGLSYNQEKGAYFYNGKTVGLFVDRQGRGIYLLNQNGEVNVKAVRDSNGNLTGLTELSAAEYTEIVTEMDTRMAELHERMEQHISEMNGRLAERMREFPVPMPRLDITPPPAPKR